jgi:nucleoid-associated protein YgaU
MSTLSISRMVVPFVTIGAVAVVTVVFADRYVRPQLSDDRAIVATAPPAASQPAASEQQDRGQNQEPSKLAAVQAETDRLSATLNAPKGPDKGPDKTPDKPLDQDAAAPEFDVASIQPTGEAVVAGRAAPGATVELLRNGELHDRTVADKDGQFVMIPRALPPGNYDLTLRSRQPDGKEATSKQRVAVAVEAPASRQPVIASSKPNEPSAQTPAPAVAAAAPPKVAVEAGTAEHSAKTEHSAEAAQARPAGSKETATIRRSQLAAAEAAVLPRTSSTASTPRFTTATVARGDSLWRISQRALGAGTRYSVLYNANRDRIRNADLIYPGQVFVLPSR